jgi:type IV secretion system protein VirB9
MGRIITGIVVVFSLASAALAQELSPSTTPTPVTEPTPSVTNGAPFPPPASTFSPSLLGGKEPELDAEEREGVEITAAWRQKSYESMVSQAGTSDSVVFRYDQSYPSIVCAILQVTDVELEPGEVVTQVNVSDTTRWSVESAVSGSGAEQTQHLIVKPRDIGLSTSLVVTTDKRTYHLMLVSDGREFMHCVRFVYAQEQEKTAAEPAPTPAVRPSPAVTPQQVAADPPALQKKPGTKRVAIVQADDADDGYVVSGHADWKPVNVYSQGGKNYLEMPASVRHREAPVLFEEVRKGWFHHEMILVNYRVKGRWYIDGKVIDKGALVSGVGGSQTRVDIRHVESRKAVTAVEEQGK